MEALVMRLEVRRDTAGNGLRNNYSPALVALVFADDGDGSRRTLAELAGLPGLMVAHPAGAGRPPARPRLEPNDGGDAA